MPPALVINIPRSFVAGDSFISLLFFRFQFKSYFRHYAFLCEPKPYGKVGHSTDEVQESLVLCDLYRLARMVAVTMNSAVNDVAGRIVLIGPSGRASQRHTLNFLAGCIQGLFSRIVTFDQNTDRLDVF